ncbi:hypothetical protein [Leuconostoc rapi]|nr:hypothetical protein [Leuconostoc rapi]MBM7435052.1 hypothetical protein [Leuconostoc rapi]
MTEQDKQKEAEAKEAVVQENKKDDPKSTDKEDVYKHHPDNADYKKAD